eukprot:Sspe_Gene.13545::Locus_4634_Transcript_2_2_Confidence_0.600_Length_512::g.13545::m.13545
MARGSIKHTNSTKGFIRDHAKLVKVKKSSKVPGGKKKPKKETEPETQLPGMEVAVAPKGGNALVTVGKVVKSTPPPHRSFRRGKKKMTQGVLSAKIRAKLAASS